MEDLTKTPNGIPVHHGDHGLKLPHLALIDDELKDWDGQFTIRIRFLPEDCPDLFSAMYGPSVGDDPIGEDEVDYEKRGNRAGPSRIIDAPHRPCRRMVIIAGPIAYPDGGDPAVYTAYGTQASDLAPREWWDASMKPLEAIEAATFWSQHALAR